MKSIFIFTILSVVLFSCNPPEEQKVPVVNGVIVNYTQNPVFLYRNSESSLLIDTISINKDGIFNVYKESVDTVGFYSLDFGEGQFVNLFLKPNDFIQLEINANDIEGSCVSKNSKFMNAYWNIERNNRQFDKEINEVSTSFQNMIGLEDADSAYSSLNSIRDSLILVYRNKSLEIIKGVDNEVLTWLMLNQKAGNVSLFDLQKDLNLFLKNSEKIGEDKKIKDLFADYDKKLMDAYSMIRSSERFLAGNEFINLSARTNWNDSLPLSKLNAKLVNVVLWNLATDIKSNRFEQIKDLQRKYNTRGLKTLLVAYEKDKEEWQNTITILYSGYWHLIDTSGVESVDLIKLGVRSFPLNFLVEPSGKIIDRDLWGETLEKRVSIFLKNN